MTEQQQHCDHECVCWMYHENKIPRNKDACYRNTGGLPSCLSDTRSRPAPQQDALSLLCNKINEYNGHRESKANINMMSMAVLASLIDEVREQLRQQHGGE